MEDEIQFDLTTSEPVPYKHLLYHVMLRLFREYTEKFGEEESANLLIEMKKSKGILELD